MSRFTDAISWSIEDVTLHLFIVSEAAGFSFAWPEGDVELRRVRATYLEDADRNLGGRECNEYDLIYEEVPENVESIVVEWLEAALEGGAQLCLFMFDAAFDMSDILGENTAHQVYAVGSLYGIELAVDDETRLSAEWTEKLLALREKIGM